MLFRSIRNALIEVAAIRISYQTVTESDAHEILDLSQRILPFLTEENDIHLFNPLFALRPVFHFNRGLAYQDLGRLNDAVDAFQDAITTGKALGNVHIVAPALGHLAEVEIIQGRMHQAAKTCQQGIALVEAMAKNASPLVGLLHVRLGHLFYEWNELEKAEHHLRKGIEIGRAHV